MNKVIIGKSIAGLAITGGTATGIAFLAFPQSKQESPKEDLEAKIQQSIQKRKKHRIGEMYEIYKKHPTEDARTEIANTIGGNGAANATFYFTNGKFAEDDIVVTAIDGWCISGAKEYKTLESKYNGFNKERLCGWEEGLDF